jgi:hypothetical protein
LTDLQEEANRLSAENDGAPVVIVSVNPCCAYWPPTISFAEAASILLAAASSAADAAVRSFSKGRMQ